jgi:DNA-binding PucR family transcriptional regulator
MAGAALLSNHTAAALVPPAATLAGVVEELGQGVLEIVAAPRGLDVAVTEAVIFDPSEPGAIESGDLVLGVGVRSDTAAAVELLITAGGTGATAVVVKRPAETPASARLVTAADEAGVALLAIPAEMAWGLLHTLVRTVLVGVGHALPAGPEGAPVGDLFALANAVAAHVGGAVTIEDPRFQVLAYSSLDQPIDEPRRQTILGRQAPDSWARRTYESGVARQLSTTGDVVHIEAMEGYRRRLAVAIRAGEEVLGSIWAVEGHEPLGRAAETALRRAAQVAALHLIRHGATDEIERRTRGEMLHALLDGRGHAGTAAAQLGVEPAGQFVVMAFELQSVDDAVIALKRERALGYVALYFEAFRRHSAAIAIGRCVYVLLPSPDESTPDRLVRMAHDIIEHTENAIRVTLHAGIGSLVTDLDDVLVSRREADQVLRVLQHQPREAVAHIEGVRSQAILLELRDLAADRPQLRFGKLQTLIDHDHDKHTEYLASLRAYLDARGDVGQAALSLGVHPNTLRYRIRRLTEISGLDLDAAEERLIAELQLRLI